MARWNKVTQAQVDMIRHLYETTELTIEQVGLAVGTTYKGALGVVYRYYDKEYRDARKRRSYRLSKLGDKNPMTGKTGSKCPHYKGELVYPNSKKGYAIILKPEWYTGRKRSKHVYVHHVVVCERLGITKIPAGWVVHHCDGDTYNNDFNNLVLMPSRVHTSLHSYLKTLSCNEGATTISKESTLKWAEKRCLMYGMSDDIVSTVRRLTAETSDEVPGME